MSGRSRNRPPPASSAPAGARVSTGPAARSSPRPPHRDDAAEHDHADEDHALDDGRQVRDRRRGRSGPSGSAGGSTTPTIGPTMPPRPPARLTPPSTIAATLWSVYGPGTGDPIPVLAVRASPPSAAEQAGRSRRRGSSSGRPGRRSGTPPAGCCRWRTWTARASTARSGIQMTDDDDEQDDERPRDPLAARTTRSTSSCEPRRRAAARRVPGRAARARPDERHGQGDDDVRAPG